MNFIVFGFWVLLWRQQNNSIGHWGQIIAIAGILAFLLGQLNGNMQYCILTKNIYNLQLTAALIEGAKTTPQMAWWKECFF